MIFDSVKKFIQNIFLREICHPNGARIKRRGGGVLNTKNFIALASAILQKNSDHKLNLVQFHTRDKKICNRKFGIQVLQSKYV